MNYIAWESPTLLLFTSSPSSSLIVFSSLTSPPSVVLLWWGSDRCWIIVLLTANFHRPPIPPLPSSARASRVFGAGEVSVIRAWRIVFIIVLFQVLVKSCW